MSGSGYRILGYAVWHGGRWYARRRLPAARALAVTGIGALSALAVAVLIARRIAS